MECNRRTCMYKNIYTIRACVCVNEWMWENAQSVMCVVFYGKREERPRTRFSHLMLTSFSLLTLSPHLISFSLTLVIRLCVSSYVIFYDCLHFWQCPGGKKWKTHYMTSLNSLQTMEQTNTAVIKRIHAFGLNDEVRTFLNFNMVPNGVSASRNTCAMINISHRPMLGLLKEVSESAFRLS